VTVRPCPGEIPRRQQIYVANASGGNPQNVSRSGGSDRSPRWAPDGKQISFISDRDGNEEVYVVDFPGGDPINITNDPRQDTHAEWSPCM
jgi:Tol biopolymer transport system component